MLLIDCPYCGERPELEFSHGGQAHIARAQNPSDLSAQEWTDFLYMRSNIKGVHAERWRHTHGCGRFFNALRDTTTDHFLVTYKAGEARPAIGVAAGAAGSTSGGPVPGAAVGSASGGGFARPAAGTSLAAGAGTTATTGTSPAAGAGTTAAAGSSPAAGASSSPAAGDPKGRS